jgi:hypothetical protein
MHTAFMAEILNMADTLKRQQERLAFTLLKAQDTDVETFVRGLEKVTGRTVSLWASLADLEEDMVLQIGVTMHDLPGLKCRKLMRTLEYVMEQGFEDTGTVDYASVRNRDYKFKRGDLHLRIGAYVRSDSKSCQRVQVGERVEVVPQYEIVCR